MLECTYIVCPHNEKEQPFCKLDVCIVPKGGLEDYIKIHRTKTVNDITQSQTEECVSEFIGDSGTVYEHTQTEPSKT
jgi:hypothetical protein